MALVHRSSILLGICVNIETANLVYLEKDCVLIPCRLKTESQENLARVTD